MGLATVRSFDVTTGDRYGKSASAIGSDLVGLRTNAMIGVALPDWLPRGQHYLGIVLATNPPTGQPVLYEISNLLPFVW